MKPETFKTQMKAALKDLTDPHLFLSDIGLIVEGNAKKRTPVATGTLRRSISNRVDGNAVYIGSAVEYALWVHEGTKYMAARPFLQDGIDDSRPRIEQMLSEFGGKILEKAAKG